MTNSELNGMLLKIKRLDVKEATKILSTLTNQEKVELDNYIKSENERLTDSIEMYREKIISVREEIYKVRNKK
ncbi:MAG: hypothetical protein J6A15_03810 [Clostridia bacterium]|nr:hypothetical protein [Clostridia bacterium]